jgi:hypothetical protein
MAVFKGSTAIDAIQLGSTVIGEVYLGSTLLYSSAPAVTPPAPPWFIGDTDEYGQSTTDITIVGDFELEADIKLGPKAGNSAGKALFGEYLGGFSVIWYGDNHSNAQDIRVRGGATNFFGREIMNSYVTGDKIKLKVSRTGSTCAITINGTQVASGAWVTANLPFNSIYNAGGAAPGDLDVIQNVSLAFGSNSYFWPCNEGSGNFLCYDGPGGTRQATYDMVITADNWSAT